MQSNTFLTNTFIKGMNLDTNITYMEDSQYRYAENVRLVTDADGTTGALLNIQSWIEIPANNTFGADEVILYCTTIKNYIVVLTVDSQGINTLYRIDDYNNPPLKYNTVVRGNLGYTSTDKVKIVCNYENDKVCNAYIACAGKMIKSCNILSDKYVFSADKKNPYVDEYGNILNPASMDIVPSAILTALHFVKLVSGSLKVGKVQYAYLLFNLNGNTTVISPVSELISLTNSKQPLSVGGSMFDVGINQGADADLNSGKGVELSLNLGEQFSGSIDFDSIRIFRVFYSSNTDAPTVDVILETNLVPDKYDYTFTDLGQAAETSYTAEEFNALVTIFNASTIEKHLNRLFAANVQDTTFDIEYDARAYRCDKNGYIILTDSNNDRNISLQLPTSLAQLKEFYNNIPEDHDCINPYNLLGGSNFTPTDGKDNMQYSNIIKFGQRLLGGSGPNISYTFVYNLIILDEYKLTSPVENALDYWNCDITSYDKVYSGYMLDLQTSNAWDEKYNITSTTNILSSYTNPLVEGYMLGYMRDEIYRFGIVFYNEKSQASPVHWIGDIRMPYAGDYMPFSIDGQYLYGNVLGIRFEVNNIPEGVTSYEIVRCDRTESDRTVVMQAIIGNTVHLDNAEGNIVNFIYGDNTAYPVIPFTNVNDYYIDWFEDTYGDGGIDARKNKYDNANINKQIKIFISPEIDISGESSKNSLDDCYIEHLYSSAPMATSLIFSRSNFDKNGRKYFHTPYYTAVSFTSDKTIEDPNTYVLKSLTNHEIPCSLPRDWVESLPWEPDASSEENNRKQVVAGLGKRYLMWHKYGLDRYRTNVKLSSNLQYPSVLEQGQLANVAPYYQNVGGYRYLNYATMTTDSVTGYGSTKRGFFGSCLVGMLEEDVLNDTHGIDLTDIINCSSGIVSEVLRCNVNPFNTSVVNFKRLITPYNGSNYSARQNSTYISIGTNHVNTDSVVYVYGGDTYLGVHDHLTSMSFPDQREGGDGGIFSNDDRIQCFFVDYIPFETTINLTKQFGLNTSSTVEGRRSYIDPYLHNTITGGTVGNYHAQNEPYYAYNDVYSAGSTIKVHTSIDDDTQLNQVQSNRIRNSMVKTAGEKSDSFTKFQQADYLDVDSQYGNVTNLKSFQNKLLYFQEDAVGIAAVNERSLITDNNLTELTLGTGGVLSRFDNLTTANGDGVENDPSITDSRVSLYWYDNRKNEICRYFNGSVEKLSKTKNIQSYLNNSETHRVHDGMCDFKFNEILMCFEDNVLVFNEFYDQFTSFYTNNPDKHAEFSDLLLYLKDNVFQYETPYNDNKMTCKIQFIVNKDVLYTKVFDNVFFGGLFDDIYYSLKEVKFNTKSQQATILKNSLNDTYAIDYREDTYRFAIGREEVSEDTMSYPGRLRGKYLVCNYTICCDDQHNFVLPYVNTTYRRSLV